MRKAKRKISLEQRDLAAAHDTVRHSIVHAIEGGPLSSKEISGLVGIPEKEVAGHLAHIRTTLHLTVREFMVQPAECVKCGFVFEKRDPARQTGQVPGLPERVDPCAAVLNQPEHPDRQVRRLTGLFAKDLRMRNSALSCQAFKIP